MELPRIYGGENTSNKNCDKTTGLYTLEFFCQQLKEKTSSDLILTVAFIDINGFGAYNLLSEKKVEADMVLSGLGGIIQNQTKSIDLAARITKDDSLPGIGGDEFVLAFYKKKEDAERIVEEISRRFSTSYQLTISYGTSQYNPNTHGSLEKGVKNIIKDAYQNMRDRKKATNINEY